MLNNFLLKTLYQKRFTLLWWLIGITFVTFITVSVYDSFKATDIEKLLEDLPPALQNIAGDASSYKTVEGYLIQQVYALRLPLLTIILAIAMLVGISAGDEQKGLLETQLAQPISRTKLLLQKLAAAMIIIALASLGALLGITLGLAVVGETFNIISVLKFTLNCVVLAAIYGLIGFTIAALTGKRGLALGISSGFAFISYLINSMAPSVSFLESFDKATFFHYYKNDPFSVSNFSILLLTAIVLIVISIIGFNRRDIRSN